MLDPNDRHVYLQALKAPDGLVLGEAIATTYSLDLTILLTVPVALTLPHLDPSQLGPEHALELFQALQQVSSRLTVFCNQGGTAAPASEHVLFSMLERVVVEVRAPHGGAFHPKLWLIRFDPEPGSDAAACLRLVVLSRNLTHDRCWDVSLLLDGTIGRKRRAKDALADFLLKLPGYALRAADAAVAERAARLAEVASRAEWELPDGFDKMQLHVLGTGKKPKRWLPDRSDRLVVISPFVRGSALTALRESTREPVALIARSEELDRVAPEILRGFDKLHVLHGASEREDGEDTADTPVRSELRGLHAKVYVAKRGWDTHLYLGSANATHAALTEGSNVEVLVELSGRTSAVPGKGIDGLLDDQGFGALLAPYELLEVAVESDAATLAAEQAIRLAVCELAQAELSLSFERRGDELLPTLRCVQRLALEGLAEAWAWLVTSNASTARQVIGLREGTVALAACSSAGATSFVAFDLQASAANLRKQFLLNVPVINMPADRDAHVVRIVVKNKERLMQFILSLLQGSDPFVRAGLEPRTLVGRGTAGSATFGAGLLEQLVRTKARHPERLSEVRSVLRMLMETPEGREVVPPELIQLWSVVTGEVLA